MDNQLLIFERELNFIKDERIKTFTIKTLEKLPKYFWEVSASSTGKHHPSYTQGMGGLSRHVKAATRIATEMFNLEMWNFTDTDKDIILSALFLHDGLKSGLIKSDKTEFDHPLQIVKFIEDSRELNSILPNVIQDEITYAIKSHMGQWDTSKYSDMTLPKPITPVQKFVHLCDYLASRKCIEINFEA